MDYFILAAGPEDLAMGFGVGFFVLVIAWLVLRWYRLQQEFAIMKLALEKGVATFPPMLPQWLVSLRQGTLIAILGIGLSVIGGIGYWLASTVIVPNSMPRTGVNVEGIPVSIPDQHESPPPPPPGRGGQPDEHLQPPPPPPPPDPQLERWHLAQQEEIICLSIIAGGIIIFLLGVVRIAFVPAERKYADQWTALNKPESTREGPPVSGV